MRRNVRILGVILFLCVAIVMSGCAKKAPMTEEPILVTKEKPSTMDQAAGEAGMEKPPAAEPAQSAEAMPQESALREPAQTQAALQEPSAETSALPAKGEVAFEDIHFAFDRYDLSPEARGVLKGLASWLLAHKNYTIIVEGHCDERGTTEYNLALGQRRASEAMKYLTDMGVEIKRTKTISYGEELPLDPGHNEEAWTKNRRGHFIVNVRK